MSEVERLSIPTPLAKIIPARLREVTVTLLASTLTVLAAASPCFAKAHTEGVVVVEVVALHQSGSPVVTQTEKEKERKEGRKEGRKEDR